MRAIGCKYYVNMEINPALLSENNTNGVRVAPVFDLVTTCDLAIAIECMHAGITRYFHFIWMARQDDSHAFQDIITAFCDCDLANIEVFDVQDRVLWPCWQLARVVAQISDAHC